MKREAIKKSLKFWKERLQSEEKSLKWTEEYMKYHKNEIKESKKHVKILTKMMDKYMK